MKKNEIKNNILKMKTKENQIKVKKKGDNNSQNLNLNKKNNKIKEPSFPRTSFNTNTNFFTVMDLIPKTSVNKSEYNTIIQSKKLNLNLKTKNKLNDLEKMSYKYYTNRKSGNPINLKEYKKLNILKEKSKENISSNLQKEAKSIRNSMNSNKYQKNRVNNKDKIIDINLLTEKANNSYEKIKKLIESSTSTINNNQMKRNSKKIKHNHSNLKSFEQIKQSEIYSYPLNIKELTNISKQIFPIKKNNSSTNSKYNMSANINNNNSYNSCYNFYQKTNNINNNINKNNYNYNKMLNTINNFEFHNYSNIYKIEENYCEKNKNKINNYILFDKENININKGKSNNITNSKNSVQSSDYKKYNASGKYNSNNKEKNIKDKQRILNKILNRDNKKLMEYKKKLIQYFCKGIEDFIYISVKKKFNDFIANLKQISIDKNTHHLLLKRLQNKAIQRNYFMDNDKTYFYKYSPQNENNRDYSNIIKMNNSNIINLKKNENDLSKDFARGYKGKKSIYNLNKTQSPLLNGNYEINQNFFNELNYSNNINPDIHDKDNKENVNYLNMINNYNNGNKTNYNNPSIYYLKRNKLINPNVNVGIDYQDKKSETNFEKTNNNNVYIPKKFRLINNSEIIDMKPNENSHNINNRSYISNRYLNYDTNNGISRKMSKNKKCNQSHDLYDDTITTKIAIKKYGSNNNFQNNNINKHCYYNSNYNLYKENNLDFFNSSNDKIKNRNNHIISGKTFDSDFNERNSIYKKKLKINNTINMYSKPNPSKIRNQILDINLNLNNNHNETIGQFLSPNVVKNNIQNLVIDPHTEFGQKPKFIPLPMSNPQYTRIAYTEPRREMNLNSNNKNRFGNIRELTVNLSKNSNINNNKIYKNKENIFIYSQNDFDNCRVKECVTNNDENNINYIKEETNMVNGAVEANDDYSFKEIIIKDVSSSDGRLNVFIKYVEIPHCNEKIQQKTIYQSLNSLKYFQIDNIYIPASYQSIIPSNIYYKNFCLGNRINNNKLKFNKILSSIIEEEEKSKAAGSANNSLISDEDKENKNINNYSHYFIQSIKYISNLLQNILDDKKKDSYYRFFKILKKIKNEAFLQGIINEKKFETLSKSKNEQNEEEKEEKDEESDEEKEEKEEKDDKEEKVDNI